MPTRYTTRRAGGEGWPGDDPRWRSVDDTASLEYARLLAERTAAEVDVAGACLSYPELHVPAAERAGLAPTDFRALDLRMIYCAAALCAARGYGRAAALQLARRALRTEGPEFWSEAPTAIHAAAPWCDRTLAWLADSWPPADSAVPGYVRKLHEVRDRQARAEAFAHEAGDLLNAAVDAMVGAAVHRKPRPTTPRPRPLAERVTFVRTGPRLRRSA